MKYRILQGLSLSSLLVLSTYAFNALTQVGHGQAGPQSAVPAVATPVVNAIAPAHVASSGSSLMASAILSNGAQQVILFDHAKATIAVYHVNASTGDIQLKSVRKVDADFSLQEFNLTEPTPSSIRKNVQ